MSELLLSELGHSVQREALAASLAGGAIELLTSDGECLAHFPGPLVWSTAPDGVSLQGCPITTNACATGLIDRWVAKNSDGEPVVVGQGDALRVDSRQINEGQQVTLSELRFA